MQLIYLQHWTNYSPNYQPPNTPRPAPVQSLNMSAHLRKTTKKTLLIRNSLAHHGDQRDAGDSLRLSSSCVYLQEVQGKSDRSCSEWLHSEYLVYLQVGRLQENSKTTTILIFQDWISCRDGRAHTRKMAVMRNTHTHNEVMELQALHLCTLLFIRSK